MASRTIANAGGNWSATGTWVEGAVPTAADDVVATATSGNLVMDASAVCRSLDFTNYVGTWSGSAALSIGTSSLAASNVALKLVVGMTVTYTGTITFVSTVTGNTITTAGQSVKNLTFNGAGGGWTLQDAVSASSGTLTLTQGNLNCNAKAMTWSVIQVTSNSLTRQITLDNCAITLTGTNTSVMFIGATTTNLTWSDAGATYNLNGSGTHTWAGNGKSFGTVTVSNGNLTITGANTFAGLVMANRSATLTLPSSTTTTASSVPSLSGAPGGLLTIVSSTGGTAATLSVAAGTVRANHASIKDTTVSGGATFEAYDTLNVSGNTGWTFKKPKKMALTGVG